MTHAYMYDAAARSTGQEPTTPGAASRHAPALLCCTPRRTHARRRPCPRRHHQASPVWSVTPPPNLQPKAAAASSEASEPRARRQAPFRRRRACAPAGPSPGERDAPRASPPSWPCSGAELRVSALHAALFHAQAAEEAGTGEGGQGAGRGGRALWRQHALLGARTVRRRRAAALRVARGRRAGRAVGPKLRESRPV